MTNPKQESASPNLPITEQQELEKLRKDFDELQQKADEWLNGWKRAKADYLNFKREQEKKQEEFSQFANAALIAELLPIINHYTLALKHVPADARAHEWMKGFDHIRKQLHDFLKKFGIAVIKTVGEKFNPEVHEAVTHEACEGFAADTVFEEVAPGYTLHGKLLEPAKVKVAK